MTGSYRTKQNHLQINCSPTDYAYLFDQKSESIEEYLAVLPRYLISRCPFCATPYTAQVDTYSLDDWYIRTLGYGESFDGEEEQGRCPHLIVIQRFVNLEGIVPVEVQSFQSILHIPFVMPFYLPDEIPAIAVIHSLPICRIEDEDGYAYNFGRSAFREPITEIRFKTERTWTKPIPNVPFAEISAADKARLATARFVPRYTGFGVTYYTLGDPGTLVAKYLDTWVTDHHIQDPDFTMADLVTVASMEKIDDKYPEGYNLVDWVRKRKLQWLNLDDSDMPLMTGPVEDFPYTNIYNIKDKRVPFWFSNDLFS